MRKFQHRGTRAWIDSWPALVGLTLLVIFLGRSVWRLAADIRQGRRQEESLALEYKELEQQHTLLEERVAELSDAYGKEKELRARYGVRRPGEKTVIFSRTSLALPEASPSETDTDTWWERLRAWARAL